MRKEIPVELEPVKAGLRQIYSALLPPATFGNPEDRERNFLSRALAAYALVNLAGCSPEQSAAAIVDGGGDGGIDAVFFSALSTTLWVIQSKYISDGDGEPDLSGVSKFKNGIEFLLQGEFESFRENAAWQRRIDQIKHHFDNDLLKVRAVLIYSGIRLVSEDRIRLLEAIETRVNKVDSDYFQFKTYNLTTIHDWLSGPDAREGVVAELMFDHPGWVDVPYQTIYGLVSLEELASLHRRHGKALVAANIRGFKGETEVNEQILQTLRDEPQHFFYLNNGLTAFCNEMTLGRVGLANFKRARVTAKGFSIVNGAQTLGSIAAHASEISGAIPNGFVFMRIISLKGCEDDRAFAERITRSTNFQNQVRLADFVALDEIQERIARQLKLSGISYHYRDDLDTPMPDEQNFHLKEAVTACACLIHDSGSEMIARIVGNRQSLISMEHDGSAANESRYSQVFRSNRSGRDVWRVVQAQRVILAVIHENAKSSQGARKAFFENSSWLIQNVLFLKLKPERGDSLNLDHSLKESLERRTLEWAEVLWAICRQQGLVPEGTDTSQVRHFRSEFSSVTRFDATELFEDQIDGHFRAVFSSAVACAQLRHALLQQLHD